jgi:hypothetical protein
MNKTVLKLGEVLNQLIEQENPCFCVYDDNFELLFRSHIDLESMSKAEIIGDLEDYIHNWIFEIKAKRYGKYQEIGIGIKRTR